MRLIPLILGGALLATGCSPCEESCKIESRHFDRCLDDWAMDWSDLEALDKTDFRKSCVADTKVYINSLEGPERTAEQNACRSLNTDLNFASTCDASWEALNKYGN